MKLGKLVTDIVMDNVFRKYFASFGGLGSKSGPFLVYQPTTINQKPFMICFWFFILLKVCSEAIKKIKNLLKINRPFK